MPEESPARIPLYADYTGPGPLKYAPKPLTGLKDHCMTKQQAPAYSLATKLQPPPNTNPAPYTIEGPVTRTGLHSVPAASLKGRAKTKGLELTPGPGSYNSDNVDPTSLSSARKNPAYSIGVRSRYMNWNCAPPPTRYSLPTVLGTGSVDKKGAPAFGLKPRLNVGTTSYRYTKANVPSPNAYGALEPNVIKNRSGVYSLGPRTKVKEYNTAKANPGPGAYNLNAGFNSGRGCSLGVRWSAYTMPLITDLDVI